MPKNNAYVVYNPHIDEFVRIKKFSDKELQDLVVELGNVIYKKGAKVTEYVTAVVKKTIQDVNSYDLSEVLESLYECSTEVYPVLQVEAICKTTNEIKAISSKNKTNIEKPKSLSDIDALTKKIQSRLVGQDQAVEECVKSIKLISSGLGKFVSLFFIGPTGVGKTELARLLAEEYLGNPKKLLKKIGRAHV